MPVPRHSTRRFPRVPAEHPALVRLLGGAPFEGFAKTRVIGLGGCMVTSRESLGFGSLMELLISFRGRVVRTDGRVVWETARTGGYDVGVEFLRLSSSDRALLSTVVEGDGGSRPRANG